MTTNIALVGIGKIAIDQHIPAIMASPDWELAATVSRNNTVKDVENYTDMDAMLKQRPDIPVVSLSIPPAPRYEYAKSAIAAGRHVMLEKPPGASLSEVQILQDLANDAGISLYATWHSREAADVAAAKQWLSDKKLHDLTITWKEDVRRWHPGQEWIWQPAGMGVFDPGINALSIVTEILPDPIHLRSANLVIPKNKQTPIAADLDFSHPSGATVRAEFDFRQPEEQIWEIKATTDAGVMRLIDGGAKLFVDDERLSIKHTNPLSGEYPRLYQNMFQLIANSASDVDLRPMTLILDAFTLGNREMTDAFIE
ncbi:D-galactose 1-dehydrogenase [Amylibacter kogurei]|uniref:D-galactose 1-dehydrogenase n=1 Tax=Paramylibacter kogurei TaxID=1889778 RepID=A0A2G5K9B9_9RHOB|nr:Gfo/Idh/MocA family oxidoreductase [Amylibacter kogurei]PIB25623.1 D-galactose 1-dehydrogenase [Amylibacter kogurei]